MCKCRACDICLPVRRSEAPPPHRLASLPPPPPQTQTQTQRKREAGRGVDAAAGHATPAPSAAAEAGHGAGVKPGEKPAQEGPPHKGRRDKPAEGGGKDGEGGKGDGTEAAGGTSGGAELAWKPGQCAEWCKAEAAADECALGGCVACTHCLSAARLAKPTETKPAKPTGPSVHDKLLTHPLLLPFPLPKHPPSSALGALVATLVGLSFFVLLALVWLRRHARPQYSALLERLPQPWAQRADLVASLGRSLGGVGYRAAYKGEGTDDGTDTDAQPAAWEGGASPAPPQGGGQRASADEDPFDEHARVAAVRG